MPVLSAAGMTRELEAAGALLRGHFILSSGRRSPVYLQCARLLMDPARATRLLAGLLPELERLRVEIVLAPALGGIVVGFELARQLGRPSVFVERVDGRFALRRGFELPPGARVLVAEDVVTTGLSTRECIELCDAAGAAAVGVACVVDRSGGAAGLDVPIVALSALDLPTYPPDALPPDLAAIPPTKPGSRDIAFR